MTTLPNKFYTHEGYPLVPDRVHLDAYTIYTTIDGILVRISVVQEDGKEYLYINSHDGLRIIPNASNTIYVDTGRRD